MHVRGRGGTQCMHVRGSTRTEVAHRHRLQHMGVDTGRGAARRSIGVDGVVVGRSGIAGRLA
eukprot:2468261-Prymnesium_polylepis.1